MNVYNAEALKPEGVQAATLNALREMMQTWDTCFPYNARRNVPRKNIRNTYLIAISVFRRPRLGKIGRDSAICTSLSPSPWHKYKNSFCTNAKIIFEQMHFFLAKMQNILAEIMQCAVVHIPPSHLLGLNEKISSRQCAIVINSKLSIKHEHKSF